MLLMVFTLIVVRRLYVISIIHRVRFDDYCVCSSKTKAFPSLNTFHHFYQGSPSRKIDNVSILSQIDQIFPYTNSLSISLRHLGAAASLICRGWRVGLWYLHIRWRSLMFSTRTRIATESRKSNNRYKKTVVRRLDNFCKVNNSNVG